MKELLMLAPKGGPGKSTIAECIRQCLGNVEVVDLDPQKTLTIALEMTQTPLSPPSVEYRLYDTPPYNGLIAKVSKIKRDCSLSPSYLTTSYLTTPSLLTHNVTHNFLN